MAGEGGDKLRIRRLKLSGFKSFVEPAELRIEPGLTGVVGPNGCGKSNLLEAIRWVMGEGSPKSLRGGGMDDVIFAGTATPPAARLRRSLDARRARSRRRGEARDGESEVTRRIERGAGSAYRIDGRDVRAKDVALLFADAATGAHSPALVSQGKIGAVIAAKPTERRLMLEEAAGISGLHARRKDAEQKLRATEANLARLDELLRDQEQRASRARRQARAAERYRQLTRQDPVGRGAAASRPLGRGRPGRSRGQARKRSSRRGRGRVAAGVRWPTRRQAQDQAAALLGRAAQELPQARERATELAHELATARARRDTVVRRLAELDRLDASLAPRPRARRRCATMPGERSRQLEAERAAIDAAAGGRRGAVGADRGASSAELEAASREAEAALADLLARQAAMRAERRVAEAALEAARAQVDRTEDERTKLAAQLEALGDGLERAGGARGGAQARRGCASRLSRSPRRSWKPPKQERAAAAERRDGRKARWPLPARRCRLPGPNAQALATRARAWRRLGDRRAVSGRRAMSARWPRRWARISMRRSAATAPGAGRAASAMAGDPALAAGLEPLIDHVHAPAAAAPAACAQIGVVDEDEGQQLAVGQRLVTRDGVLRRWDGFVATAVGRGRGRAADPRQPARRARRAAAEARRGGSQAASTARDNAAGDVERWRTEGEEQRRAAAAAEREAREAERAADAAAAAIERLNAQRDGACRSARADLEARARRLRRRR